MKHLIKKEFIQMRRNAFIPKLIFIFPIMIMCVMPWVMDMEVRNINTVVVDNDRSTTSVRLTQRIGQSGHFRFCGQRPSYREAMNDIEKGTADIIICIPAGYGRDIVNGPRAPQVLIAANAVNGTKGAMGASYLAAIVGRNLADTPAMRRKAGAPAAVNVATHYLYNKHLDYKVFMIPALMSILMMMLCGFLPALNIVGEKESGTIEQINVTPVGKRAFIFAKLIPYWIVGMVVLTICFTLAWLVYGITPAGSLPLLYAISILLALIFSGFGLIVSNYSDTMQQAMFVMWFFVVCMMLLSGLFTPIGSMPLWAQNLTLANPLRYYIDAMRTVFVRGGTLADIAPQAAVLTLFAAVTDVWAVLSYRKNS